MNHEIDRELATVLVPVTDGVRAGADLAGVALGQPELDVVICVFAGTEAGQFLAAEDDAEHVWGHALL